MGRIRQYFSFKSKGLFEGTQKALVLLIVFSQIVAPIGPVFTLGQAHAANEISVSTHQAQLKDGSTGNLLGYTTGSSNVTTYTELDSINFRFDIASSATASGQMQIEFTSQDTGCLFFDGSFSLGTHDGSALTLTNVNGTAPTVTKNSVAANDGDDWIQVLDVNFADSGSATVNYFLTLTDEAGECSSGSPQHSRLANGPEPGNFKNIGNQNIPIPAKEIIELPEIFVQKWVDRDGDGVAESQATAGEWGFSLNGGTPVPTDSDGEVIFTNVTPDGNHAITEHNGPADQSFLEGTGTNCTFQDDEATATVQSGATAQDATCIFKNQVEQQTPPATLQLIKEVINNDDGERKANEWTLTAKAAGQVAIIDEQGTLDNNKAATNKVIASPGTAYVLSESGPTGYSSLGWSCEGGDGDELEGSTVTLDEGEEVICTIVNDDIEQETARITVIKRLRVSQDNQDLFDFNITRHNGEDVVIETIEDLGGNNKEKSVEVPVGSYSIEELAGNEGVDLSNYHTDIDCKLNEQLEEQRNGLELLLDLLQPFDSERESDERELTNNDHLECIFTNTELGSISGAKYQADTTNPEELSEELPTLEGWTIFIDENGNGLLDTGEESTVTNEDGDYRFDSLWPRESSYQVCEVVKDNWVQVLPVDTDCYEVFLGYGEYETNIDFYNFTETPLLELDKFVINSSGDTLKKLTGQHVDDIVIYQLVVEVPEDSGVLHNTVVTDLPPEGIEYLDDGNWGAELNRGGSITDLRAANVVEEPEYESPGDWELGTILPGDIITLTYNALISEEVSPGDYPDLAFATGTHMETTVYSNVNSEAEAETPFVGTAVQVVEEPATVDVFTAAETVTRLPSTGPAWLDAVFVPIALASLYYMFARRKWYKQIGGRI